MHFGSSCHFVMINNAFVLLLYLEPVCEPWVELSSDWSWCCPGSRTTQESGGSMVHSLMGGPDAVPLYSVVHNVIDRPDAVPLFSGLVSNNWSHIIMQQAGHTEAGSCLHLPLADYTEHEASARIRPVTVCGFDFMFCNIFVIVSASFKI